jgi:hypothetical protein
MSTTVCQVRSWAVKKPKQAQVKQQAKASKASKASQANAAYKKHLRVPLIA